MQRTPMASMRQVSRCLNDFGVDRANVKRNGFCYSKAVYLFTPGFAILHAQTCHGMKMISIDLGYKGHAIAAEIHASLVFI